MSFLTFFIVNGYSQNLIVDDLTQDVATFSSATSTTRLNFENTNALLMGSPRRGYLESASNDMVLGTSNNNTGGDILFKMAGVTKMTMNDDGNIGMNINPSSSIRLNASTLNDIWVIKGLNQNVLGTSDVVGIKAETINQNSTYRSFGIEGTAENAGSGDIYGGWFRGKALSGFTGNIYGIRASTSGNSTGTIYAGYFQGDVYTTGVYLPSDPKLKHNIQSSAEAVNKLMLVQVRDYEYDQDKTSGMSLPRGKHTGVMADNIKALYPELIKSTVSLNPNTPGKDDIQFDEIEFDAVNYIGLIPHLIKAIQEQQVRIDKLEKKLSERE